MEGQTITDHLLQIIDLKKEYPGGFVLGPLAIELQPGETVAFLGKNGAGKTTLFQALTGNSDVTAGEIQIRGKKLTPDRPKLKREIGYLPQHMALPRWATGEELLGYCARLYGLKDIPQTIENAMRYWDCYSYRRQPLAACSHGMQKRVGLAIACLHDPNLLVLDEPFSGLDIYHIRALEELIEARGEKGKTTIVSTHIALYVARLCQRVFVLQEGQMQELTPWGEADFGSRVARIEGAFFEGAS